VSGFLDILLRGLALSGQAIVTGGIVFALLVLRPVAREDPLWTGRQARTLLLIALGAGLVILAQALSVTLQLGTLILELGTTVREAFVTSYFRASAVKVLIALAVMVDALALRRRAWRGGWPVLAGLGVLLAAGAAWTSHAAARLEHRAPLLVLDALHQLAAGVWIGGLLHLIVVASPDRDRRLPGPLLRRVSSLSLAAVLVLCLSGVGLALYYIDSWQALLGTGYGLMVATKVAMLGGLALLGAMNFFAVRGLSTASETTHVRLRRFVEVELGAGLIVFFAAASLTSLPPAVDVVDDRATLAEVGERFTPQWPSFSSPPLEALPLDDPEAERTDADRQWSEYNHHMAGVFVLTMAVLAILNRLGTGWARHWPLVFLVMAAFLVARNDPGSWPLGPEGFWEGFLRAEVFQHRLFVLVVVGFGVFEWAVRTGRVRSSRCALVFPLLCVVGGGLLLTHSHAILSLKAEYLVEVTHAPLGLIAVMAGWSRWLELRLPAAQQRLPGRLWTAGMVMVGVLLLLYRES
jgi:putative copper resistance protein D